MKKITYVNKELCAKCGGKCCLKCGCVLSANEVEDKRLEGIEKLIDQKNLSITALVVQRKDALGKMFMVPILYLRVRNEGRGKVDLVSYKKKCSILTEEGCPLSFEERPFGAKNLIPSATITGKLNCYCEVDPNEILKTWEPYQKILSRIVKRVTGNTVLEQLRVDAYQMLLDTLNGDFEGVSPRELYEVKESGFLLGLKETYPNEYKKALNEHKRGAMKPLK